jgi:hypothetical protein
VVLVAAVGISKANISLHLPMDDSRREFGGDEWTWTLERTPVAALIPRMWTQRRVT